VNLAKRILGGMDMTTSKSTKLISLMAFASILTLTSCENFFEVQNIYLEYNHVGVSIGGERQITSVVQPEYAVDKALTWSSLDSTIVSVNQNGLIKGESHGTTTITVMSENGVYSEFFATTYFEAGDYELMEIEPINTKNIANEIFFNGTFIYGYNPNKEDIDYFSISLVENSRIFAYFGTEFITDQTQFNFSIEYNDEIVFSSIFENDNSYFAIDVVEPGTYYIRINYSENSPFLSGEYYAFHLIWL